MAGNDISPACCFFFFAFKTSLHIGINTGRCGDMVLIKLIGLFVAIYATAKLGGVAMAWINKLFEDLKPDKD